jgi:ribosomal protein L40E
LLFLLWGLSLVVFILVLPHFFNIGCLGFLALGIFFLIIFSLGSSYETRICRHCGFVHSFDPEVVRWGEADEATIVGPDVTDEEEVGEPTGCPSCGATIPENVTKCPACGWSYT